MRKVNYFALLVWCLILVACAEQADEKPELNDLRGDFPCLEDPFGNCVPGEDDEDDGGPGSGPGGNPGNTGGYKVYMKGETSMTVNQGTSTSGYNWLAQGGVTGASIDIPPSATKFGNNIYVFHSSPSMQNGSGYYELLYSKSSTSGNTWTNHSMGQFAPFTRVGTSAVVHNNQIYVAYRRINDNSIRIVNSSNGSTWNFHSEAVTHAQNNGGSEPYLVTHNNELYVFYVSSGRVKYKKLTPLPSISWGSPIDATAEINGSDILSGGGVTGVSFNNTIRIVYRDYNDNLISANALAPLGSRFGTYVSNNAKSSRRPSLATDGSIMVLLYRGSTTTNVRYSTSSNGTSWTGNVNAVGDTELAPYVIRY